MEHGMNSDIEISAELECALIDSVEAGFAEQLAFTRRMVAFRSVRGDESELQAFFHQALQQRGYEVESFGMDRELIERHPGGSKWSDTHSSAPIIVGTHHPREERGRSLILQGHVDVVPTGPQSCWERDPFAGEIDGQWMYGRGAGDMKAGCAANLFALDALRRIGLQPAARVHIQSVVEEESTGNGALMAHLRGYRADAALVPEPEGEQLVRANVGVLWFQVMVRGLPVHVHTMGEGGNAIDGAYRLIGALRELEQQWNERKVDHPLFAELAHPINLNIGKIEGGDWASSVPCWCRVDCRISLYPGVDADSAAKEISDCITAFAASDPLLSEFPPELTFNGFYAEGYVLEPGSQAEAVLARAHRAVFGTKLETMVSPAYLDARVYALYDRIPALCYGPVAKNVHGYDEAVDLDSLKQITKAMALFIAQWCKTEPVTAEGPGGQG